MPEPPDPASTARHRAARWQAVLTGAGFGVAARIVSVTCTLAQVPIALEFLGMEGFGLWMTLTSIAGFLTMGDLGLTLGAKTILAEAHGQDDPVRLRSLAEECFRTLLRFGAALALIGVLLAWFVGWSAVLGVESPALARQLPWALAGLAIASGATIPAALGTTLASALQLAWVQHVAVAAGGLLTFAIVVVASAINASWLTLVLSMLALPALINAAILLALRRRLRWRGTATRRPTPDERRRLHRLSRWFLLPQLGSLFLVMSVPIAIAAVAGPVAVAAFNLLQRVFGLVNQVHWMTLSALWPAYSEANARGDYAWMRRAYHQSWFATAITSLPAIALLAVFMPQLVALWVGSSAPSIPPSLLWTSAAWFAVQQLGQPPALVLNGLGRLRAVAIHGSIGHALSLVGMIVGGRLAGPIGVLAGIAVGYLLIGLPAAIIEASRALRQLPA